MKKTFAFGMATAFFCAATPGFSQTLNQALASAYKNSGVIEQSRALLRASDENVAQATAALRPVINWSSSVSREFNSQPNSLSKSYVTDAQNVSISGSLLLYDFGASSMAKAAQVEAVKSARMGLLNAEISVLNRAVNAYLKTYLARRNVTLRQGNLRLIERELQAARDRFEVGEGTRTDIALTEARLAAAKSALAVAQGEVATTAAEFKAAIGEAPANLQLPQTFPKLPGSPKAALGVAARAHPLIKQAQFDIKVADFNYERAKASLKPSVNVTGSVSQTRTYSGRFDSRDDSRRSSISIGASGPIYQGGRLSSLVRQAQAQMDAQRAVLHIRKLEIEQGIENSFAFLTIAQSTKAAANQQIEAAQLAYDGVREEAQLGARTTLDVLNQEQELLDAKTSRISAQVDEYVAAYGVLASAGVLTARDLRLNVPIYDPNVNYEKVKSAPVLTPQGETLKNVLEAIGMGQK